MTILTDLVMGDYKEKLSQINAQSVSLVCVDMPYGYGVNKWDEPIDIDQLWHLLRPCLKKNYVAAFTCDFRLGSRLFRSNEKEFRYDLIWQKVGRPSGHLNARRAPLRTHETILIFSGTNATYSPQMEAGAVHNRHKYVCDKANGENFRHYEQKVNMNNGTRYPKSIVAKKRLTGPQEHPTQKPLELIEWLILTYSRPGDVVLDFCAGSGTTAVAAYNTDRNSVCIEKDARYFASMQRRVDLARSKGHGERMEYNP